MLKAGITKTRECWRGTSEEEAGADMATRVYKEGKGIIVNRVYLKTSD